MKSLSQSLEKKSLNYAFLRNLFPSVALTLPSAGIFRCYMRAFPKDFLNWGNYSVDLKVFQQTSYIDCIADESDIVSFTVATKQRALGAYMGREPGDITPVFVFTENKL